MSIGLRGYAGSDWPGVRDLWIETWTLARPDIDFSARASWLSELVAESLKQGARVVVAEDASGLLGFVLYDPQKGWLEQIAVHPRAYGGGAARALIGRAKADCPRGLGLSVNTDNARALAFYQGEGFLREGEGRNPLSGLPIYTLRWTPQVLAR